MLLVAGARAGEEPEVVRALKESARGRLHELELAPLAPADGAALARSLLQAAAVGMCREPAGRAALSISLAEALVLAGRARDAAPLFLACAERAAAPVERARLERRAAEEWLKCGRVDEGIEVLRRVLSEVGLRYPDAPAEALARALVRVLRIRRLDGSFEERAEETIPRATLARVDAARVAGVGLMMIDPLRGYGFLARFLLDAIAAGEPRRVSAGLSLNAVTLCRSGEVGYPRAKLWLDRARVIADRLDDTYLRGLADACEAGASVTTGRWSAGARFGLESPALLRASRTPATWESTAAVSLGRTSLYALGRLADLRAHTAKHLREAEDVGDLFAATYARVHGWVLAAMDGEIDRGRDELERALARWSRLGFHAMHFWRLYGELMYDLYEGVPRRGLERLERARGDLSRSRILAMQFYAAFLGASEASLELAVAASERRGARARERRLARVEAIADELEGMRRPYAGGLSSLARGRALALRGDDARALAALDRAVEGFTASEMQLHVAAARAQRGVIAGGEGARDQVGEARALLAAEGVRDPARWLAMLGADLGT